MRAKSDDDLCHTRARGSFLRAGTAARPLSAGKSRCRSRGRRRDEGAQLSPASLDGFWRKRFPGEIAERLVAAAPLEGELTLEGHKLVVIDMGRTDTARSTALHVPSLDLIVAGDTVYNGIHPYLAETDTQSRLEWIAALDRLAALKPRFVVAGHKKPDNDDDPRNIAATRQYLLDFNRLDKATTSPRELYEAMLELHPDRANPGSLWSGANAAKGQKS
ncbi:MBL fold metallo-hydrolase [Bradyrhizobium diazoefficiens]